MIMVSKDTVVVIQDDKAKFQARLKKIADDTLTMAKDFGPWIFVAVAIAAYLNTMVISNAAYDHTSSLAVSFLGSLLMKV